MARFVGGVLGAAAVFAVAGVIRLCATADAGDDVVPRSAGGWAVLLAGALAVSLVVLAVLFGVGRAQDRRRPPGRHRGSGPEIR